MGVARVAPDVGFPKLEGLGLIDCYVAYYSHIVGVFAIGLVSGGALMFCVGVYYKWTHPDSTRPTLILPGE